MDKKLDLDDRRTTLICRLVLRDASVVSQLLSLAKRTVRPMIVEKINDGARGLV